MNRRIELADNPSVRLEDVEVEPRSDATVVFTVDGTISLDESVLAAVAGRTLTPAAVAFSTGDSGATEVDLREGATLRLESVDVGVELPDGDEIPTGATDARSAVPDPTDPAGSGADGIRGEVEVTTARAGTIAFTVEGRLENLAPDELAALSSETPAPTLRTITLSANAPLETDGGDPNSDEGDPVAEFVVLLYRVTIRRNGTVVIDLLDGLDPTGGAWV